MLQNIGNFIANQLDSSLTPTLWKNITSDNIVGNLGNNFAVYQRNRPLAPVLNLSNSEFSKYRSLQDIMVEDETFLVACDSEWVNIDNPDGSHKRFILSWQFAFICDDVLKMADENILLSFHPFYAYDEEDYYAPGLSSSNTERNPEYSTYIEYDTYDYIIGSFFAGSTENILKLCDKIINMMAEDLKKEGRRWYIPKYMDEAYLNSISLHDNELSFKRMQFVVLKTFEDYFACTICKQKDFSQVKEERIIDSL